MQYDWSGMFVLFHTLEEQIWLLWRRAHLAVSVSRCLR